MQTQTNTFIDQALCDLLKLYNCGVNGCYCLQLQINIINSYLSKIPVSDKKKFLSALENSGYFIIWLDDAIEQIRKRLDRYNLRTSNRPKLDIQDRSQPALQHMYFC